MLISEIYHHEPWTISPDKTVKEAMVELIKDGCNGLVVTNEDTKVVGVLAIQDIAAATIPHEFRDNMNLAAAMFKKGFFREMCEDLSGKLVKDVMRTEYVDVNLETNIMAVMADFLQNDLYLVPVVEDGKLLGIVSRSDIKRALAERMGIIKLEDQGGPSNTEM